VKLVFFGGCFNPPHRGHVEIIRQCLNLCDKFILMPTLNSPLKIIDSQTDPLHIMQMLNLVIRDIDISIEIDTYDLTCSGPSYTIDTIRYLRDKYADYSISMVVGADQMMKFEQWKDYHDIINFVHIICFNRKNYNITHLSNINLTWIEDFKINISSDEIRKDILKGKLDKENLSLAVKEYIINNKLYGSK